MGKLRSNFVGTEFQVCCKICTTAQQISQIFLLPQVFDDGSSPSGPEAGERTSEHVRTELGSVMYAPNVLGSRGPRKMQVSWIHFYMDYRSSVTLRRLGGYSLCG